jgi:hypothetical protein
MDVLSEKYGLVGMANFVTGDGSPILEINGWPKSLATKLILWYRHYISPDYPLYLIVSGSGDMIELIAHTSLDEIEKMYPSPVSDEMACH